MEKRELLRHWLRGKAYHVLDIKKALEWYDMQRAAEADPTDEDVLKICDDSHKEAIGEYVAPIREVPQVTGTSETNDRIFLDGRPLQIPEINHFQLFIWGFTGGSAAFIGWEAMKWLLMAYR